MPFFDTPGSLRDAPTGSPFYDEWSAYLSGALSWRPAPTAGPGWFYDPSEPPAVTPVGERALVWMGFPRTLLTVQHRDERGAAFARGDDRATLGPASVQDEYLEWHTERNAKGRITKVTFVTETPEYWRRLAAAHFDVVVDLYRSLVSPTVAPGDLQTAGGDYDPLNVWNTRQGIVHYVQASPANTLDAAIGLASGSALSPFTALPDNYAADGGGTTSADPRVQLDIAMLVRKDLAVTLGQPIGVYMVDWDDTGWSKPNGSPVGNYWRVVRGTPEAALRLEYRVPAREGFVVGDIRIGGRRIEHGGEIAEHVTVMVGGVAGVK